MSTLKSIYVLCCDNGEQYEDYSWWIYGVYDSKGAAVVAAKQIFIDHAGELPQNFSSIWNGEFVGEGFFSYELGHIWIDERPLLRR